MYKPCNSLVKSDVLNGTGYSYTRIVPATCAGPYVPTVTLSSHSKRRSWCSHYDIYCLHFDLFQ